jgi:hypothetical protein
MSSHDTMQVNSAQDYLTMKKRQIISTTYYSTPPEQKGKTNAVYLSTVANTATTRQRFILPSTSAWGGVPGTASFVSWCSLCETSAGAAGTAGAPGVFRVVNIKDVMSRQALRPIGIRSTISQQ